MGGFTIRIGLSELGPLQVFVNVKTPTGVMLVPQIGLVMNDFTANVQFFSTLPSIEKPEELRGPAFQLPTVTAADQWLSTVKQQVVNQYLRIKANPGMGSAVQYCTGWATGPRSVSRECLS